MAVFNKLTSLIVAAAAFTCVASLPTFPDLPGVPTLPTSGYTKIDFSEAAEMCKTVGPDVFGVIRYASQEHPQAFKYGECFKLVDKTLMDYIYLCKPVTCYTFSDNQCQRIAVGAPVPVPIGSVGVPNTLDIAQLVGQGAYCQPYHLQL